MTPLLKLVLIVVLPFLVACTLPRWEVEVTAIPGATATQVGAAVVTRAATPIPRPVTSSLSPTPDPTRLDAEFVSPEGILTFRYPASWTVDDRSGKHEILVSAHSPPGEPVRLFVVNLLPVERVLVREKLQALADTYLRNFFGDRYETSAVRYDQVDDRLITTYVDYERREPVHFELRFVPRPPFYQVLILIAPQKSWLHSFPHLDRMARSVVLEPDNREQLPTPTPAGERVSQGLIIQNNSLFQASTGSLYLVGEVVNRSERAYEDVQITIDLQAEDGEVLAQERWAIPRKLLLPGEKSPLLVIFGEPPEEWATTRALADALPATFYPSRITTDFEVTGVELYEPLFADYGLRGTIRSPAEETRFVEIVGTLFDRRGKVLAVESLALERDVLPAGDAFPFHLIFYGKAEGQVDSYQILVEGIKVPGAQ